MKEKFQVRENYGLVFVKIKIKGWGDISYKCIGYHPCIYI